MILCIAMLVHETMNKEVNYILNVWVASSRLIHLDPTVTNRKSRKRLRVPKDIYL